MPGAYWQAVGEEQTHLAKQRCEQLRDQATSIYRVQQQPKITEILFGATSFLTQWSLEGQITHNACSYTTAFPWAVFG